MKFHSSRSMIDGMNSNQQADSLAFIVLRQGMRIQDLPVEPKLFVAQLLPWLLAMEYQQLNVLAVCSSWFKCPQFLQCVYHLPQKHLIWHLQVSGSMQKMEKAFWQGGVGCAQNAEVYRENRLILKKNVLDEQINGGMECGMKCVHGQNLWG